MLAGLKNDNDQAAEMEPFCDFAVVEESVRYKEFELLQVFVQNDKPVFGVEYTDYWNKKTFSSNVCPKVAQTGISFILKQLDLLNDDKKVSCL